MKPYANESEVVQIEGLTIENRADRISVYGEIDITRDRKGLSVAKEIKVVVDATIKALEAEESKGELPDQVGFVSTVTVANPFG